MKNVLIIGGSGQLGRTVLTTFKTKSPKWNTFNIDFSDNKEATDNYKIDNTWKTNESTIPNIHKKFKITKYDCIVSVAGGWQMEALDSARFIISTDEMMNMSFYSSLLAAHLASLHLNNNAPLVLTGAFGIYSQNNPSNKLY